MKFKTNINEDENPLVEFLLALESIKDDIKDALEEFEESGKALGKDKQARHNLQALKAARQTLATAYEELDELHATVLSGAPESVLEEVGSGKDIDTSPEGIQSLQAQMRGHLERVGNNPTRMACEATCTAADVMFRTQLAMINQTYEATESIAAQARDMAMESAALVYQDTCMQAVETCKAVEEAQGGRSKRTLQ